MYKDALEIELKKNSIPYQREKSFTITYDEMILRHTFDSDFFVYDAIILEIKAAYQFHTDNFKQTLNYFERITSKVGNIGKLWRRSVKV